MAFHHRKLLDESLSDDPASICKPSCDAAKSTGKCPLACSKICPPESCKEITSLFPPPPPPSPPPQTPTIVLAKTPKLSLLLTASLAVLATAFFIFTCYTIYRFYAVWRNSRRRRQRQPQRRQAERDVGPDEDLLDEDYGPVVDHPIWYIRTIGLQPSVINAITTVKYKIGDGLVDGTDCAVCLSEFQEDETLRLLPKCNHAFHIPCIDTWLASHTNCPMCRAGVVINAAGPVAPQDPAPHAEEEVSREARVGIEDDGPGRSESGPEMNESVEGGAGDWKSDVGGEEGVQGVRRSVSMDSVSASMISAAVAKALRDLNNNNNNNNNKNSDKHEECRVGDVGRRSVGVNRDLLRLASTERYMQTGGSSSIKRSASCSAKVFLSRHSSSSR